MTAALLNTRLTGAYAVLVAITLASWLTGHALGNPDLSGALILVLAFAKTWVVVREFMEVRHAPRWLRLTTGAWVLGACTLLVGLHTL